MAYQPPKQSLAGQVVDVVVLLVLTVGALYLPLYMGLAGAAKTPNPDREPDLGSARPERGRAGRNGRCSASRTRPPPTRSSPPASTTPSAGRRLIVMVVAVVGYFVLVVRLSDREYREVIDERFGKRKG